MAVNVLMPKWGMTMEEGRVNCWLKKEGEPVERGQPLAEVESSKATEFVEAPATGILARVLVPEGQTVPIATVIGVIGTDGESLPEEALGPVKSATEPTSAKPILGEQTARGRETAPHKMRLAVSPAARRLAHERQVDLSALKGTGPDGMIVAADVEAALQNAPAFAPLSGVAFFSHGHKLDGILCLPKVYRAGTQVPGVIFALGFTQLKDFLAPEMAKRLTAQGYACLLFDYRGFGKSEGPRGQVFPLEQAADIRAAVTYLATRPEVDGKQIGLVGVSLGGSHALYVAGLDDRVQAVVAISPVGNCGRWLRGRRPYWEWLEFLAQIQDDRAARVRGGPSRRVDAWDIVAPDPDSRTYLEALLREFPVLKCDLSLESAQALIDYCPEAVVERIAPRPVLLVHGDSDLLVPLDESRNLFIRMNEPRKLVVMPGMGHFDCADPKNERFSQVMEAVSHWLAENLAQTH
jgi:pimeloyl-ACP methyl ester carboxylesterase